MELVATVIPWATEHQMAPQVVQHARQTAHLVTVQESVQRLYGAEAVRYSRRGG